MPLAVAVTVKELVAASEPEPADADNSTLGLAEATVKSVLDKVNELLFPVQLVISFTSGW